MSINKKKNTMFSEEIDSSINGFALGVSFVLVALFVICFEIFNNPIIEKVIAIILLLIGGVGTMTEIEKIKKNDIKGFGDVIRGLFFIIPSFWGIVKSDIIWIHALLLLLLLLGMYGLMRGVFEIIYSLKLRKRESSNKKVEVMQIVVALTEIIALIVVVLQLISEIR